MEIAAVRISSELIGFERGKQTEQEQMRTVTQSFSELKINMEKQHVGDMDALSEEAVKVTNRLKGKLTVTEQKNVQISGQYSQLLAINDNNENEILKMKRQIVELKNIINEQEEKSRIILCKNQSTALDEINEMKFQSEKLKENLLIELESLKISGKKDKMTYEITKKENEAKFDIIQQDLECKIHDLQKQSNEIISCNEKLKKDLSDKQESFRTLAEDSLNRKESSSLIKDLTQSLQRSLNEKNIFLEDIKNLKKEKVFK